MAIDPDDLWARLGRRATIWVRRLELGELPDSNQREAVVRFPMTYRWQRGQNDVVLPPKRTFWIVARPHVRHRCPARS